MGGQGGAEGTEQDRRNSEDRAGQTGKGGEREDRDNGDSMKWGDRAEQRDRDRGDSRTGQGGGTGLGVVQLTLLGDRLRVSRPCKASSHTSLALGTLCHVPMSPTACRALVDELEWEISQVDPRKTIQMGSFRINPDGSQSVVEVRPPRVSSLPKPLLGSPLTPPGALQVPYARSEAHLTELLERVCEKMKEYGEKEDPATHRKSYVRVISHDGTKMDLSGVKFDGDVTSSLKFAVCEGTAGS